MNELKASKGDWKVNLLFVESAGRMIADCGISNYGGQEEELANVNLMAQSKNMYAMIDSLIYELSMAIDEVNTMRDIHHTDNLTPADHWDKESCHDGQVLLSKCRGE